MDTPSYKTVSANKATARKEWVLIDAENEVLGRLASLTAYLLRGKHKTNYTTHVDMGDNVVVINADKVKLTGKKMTDKVYTRYTGFPGGQRFATPKELMAKNPTMIVRKAVSGMLPKSKLGDVQRRNIFVYVGTDHPHAAQQPKQIKLDSIK